MYLPAILLYTSADVFLFYIYGVSTALPLALKVSGAGPINAMLLNCFIFVSSPYELFSDYSSTRTFLSYTLRPGPKK